MWTIKYKGFYIHGWTYTDNCYVATSGSSRTISCKSLRGAKCAISRWINKGV